MIQTLNDGKMTYLEKKVEKCLKLILLTLFISNLSLISRVRPLGRSLKLCKMTVMYLGYLTIILGLWTWAVV